VVKHFFLESNSYACWLIQSCFPSCFNETANFNAYASASIQSGLFNIGLWVKKPAIANKPQYHKPDCTFPIFHRDRKSGATSRHRKRTFTSKTQNPTFCIAKLCVLCDFVVKNLDDLRYLRW
jgi:hypothetical protein